MAASSKSTETKESQANTVKENNTSSSEGGITNSKDGEDFGYFFFPERDRLKKQEKSFLSKLWNREDITNFKCKANVLSCMKSNDKVKLMVTALESHGCPVELDRHISCEMCRDRVNGGFDPKSMQVVICQNNVHTQDVCCNVLAHELLHAFDYCRAKVNFENLRHLACSEIRAANMFHCSLGAAMSSGEASLFHVKERHQLCVKNKALQSMRLVRNVTEFEAMMVIDDVFDKCYNDTEPFGRRCFKNLGRAKRALNESRNYYDFSDID
uniref:Mitochondrial inner membrane protease ATP23 n=1 Tax=Biomphalaria glabrata TaxID=6526 RepID=A0A2C9L735_BIOGL